uniref:Uncharacterized protein n=1 Tax=Rhizophora mucronata TaxID=61149 RepID=A0A2P2NQ68_RHIMU
MTEAGKQAFLGATIMGLEYGIKEGRKVMKCIDPSWMCQVSNNISTYACSERN